VEIVKLKLIIELKYSGAVSPNYLFSLLNHKKNENKVIKMRTDQNKHTETIILYYIIAKNKSTK